MHEQYPQHPKRYKTQKKSRQNANAVFFSRIQTLSKPMKLHYPPSTITCARVHRLLHDHPSQPCTNISDIRISMATKTSSPRVEHSNHYPQHNPWISK